MICSYNCLTSNQYQYLLIFTKRTCSVLRVWSTSYHPESATRAHAFLDGLSELHNRGLLVDLYPNTISYNHVLSAYQKQIQQHHQQQNGNRYRHHQNQQKRGISIINNAEQVYQELVDLYESTQQERYRPDVVTYCCILNMLVDQPVQAEQMLLQMYKHYQMEKDKKTIICPDASCFNQVILAWAKQGRYKRAELILRLMQDIANDENDHSKSNSVIVAPTTETYNIVLYALKNSGESDAPMRAQMLLEQMKTSNNIQPDEITYTTSISVWCQLGGKQSLEYTEKLIESAIQSSSSKKNFTIGVAFFANVLSSLASCSHKDAIAFAEDLVEKRMPSLGLQPNIEVWNGLLNCFAKRGIGAKAIDALEKLEHPNQQTYTIVLDALAKSDWTESISKAESIMEQMQQVGHFQPDVRAYTALIQKYARSNIPMKAKRAHQVLQQMKEGPKKCRPTVVTYNALLNACEYTPIDDLNEKEDAFSIACLVFDEVRKELQPTHVTYGTFLGIVSKLMPRSSARAEIAELVFKRCCKDGQVSPLVLRRLKEAVPFSNYRTLLGGQSEDRLPKLWTANVRERRPKPLNKRKSFSKHKSNRYRST